MKSWEAHRQLTEVCVLSHLLELCSLSVVIDASTLPLGKRSVVKPTTELQKLPEIPRLGTIWMEPILAWPEHLLHSPVS